MISKEEINQLQKLTRSITAMHSDAAYGIPENISLYRSAENIRSLNILIFNVTDNQEIQTKTIF
ncbi:hypothetical protein ACLI50_09845 [Chryseobacterium sp. EZn1]|uniref:hypothetical protein n=1 Tax=unclassified Chryseobacterium TaxID=2593645 RepID=UPI000D709924|nr:MULTISPECIES: hypothetical protein [unclassified Chryseobacterium]PWW27643.1 hypothetical protein DEU40_106143 [Chryseobacterium sp. AG844]